MRWVIAVGTLASCSGPEDDGGYITSSGGDDIVIDTTSEAVEYDLGIQPLSVNLFFALKDDQIGTELCYDKAEVENLLMGDGPDEFTWTSREITENYLSFENNECFATTEFVIRGDGAGMWSMLIQTSKNGQQVDVFSWNEGGREWYPIEYPKPEMIDFYRTLPGSEGDLVNEFGYYYAYMENEGRNISYVFSTWQMGLNADGKEIMEFTKDPDFTFELMENEGADDSDKFWLKKVYENNGPIPDRYFLAYSETGDISEGFSYFSDMIGEQLESYGVESSFSDFTQTDYQGYFLNDTFDFGVMKQFEPRNGYWFYEKGKEPIDLEYDMIEPTIQKAKRYFDEKF
ncbi:MAG: hypothetical protein ACI857_001842 [Arenicella sp.]|jgi:hypothetical protein